MAGRRAKRHRVRRHILVGFLGAGTRFTGDLVDLSRTGMLVRTPTELEPGAVGRAGIALKSETLRSVVTVRRRVPQVGLAFEFTQMNQHDRELLHSLLLRLAGES